MKAIILVAGYATRLQSVLKDKPKALVEIKGKPVLQRIMEKLYSELPEVDETILVSNNKFYPHFKEFASRFPEKKITVLNDGSNSPSDMLGTIGDLNFALKESRVKGPFVEILGDNLFDFSLKEPCNFFKKKNSTTVMLYDIQDFKEAKKFGVVELDKNFRIVGFEEKPQNPKSTLVSTGVYFFENNCRKLLRECIENQQSDKMGAFIEWLYRKQPVYGFPCRGCWFDIGTPDTLEKVRKEFPE